MTPKVLVVLTSHDKLGDTGHPTGWYLVRHHFVNILNCNTNYISSSPNSPTPMKSSTTRSL